MLGATTPTPCAPASFIGGEKLASELDRYWCKRIQIIGKKFCRQDVFTTKAQVFWDCSCVAIVEALLQQSVLCTWKIVEGKSCLDSHNLGSYQYPLRSWNLISSKERQDLLKWGAGWGKGARLRSDQCHSLFFLDLCFSWEKYCSWKWKAWRQKIYFLKERQSEFLHC